MYEADSKDIVVELAEVPKPDIGAPTPTLVSDDCHLFLAYYLSEPDPNWDGSYVNVVSRESEGLGIALIEFI